MKKSFMNNIKNFVDSNVRQRIDRAANNNTDFFDEDLLALERQFEILKQFCIDADKRISSLLQTHSSSSIGNYTQKQLYVQASLNNLSTNLAHPGSSHSSNSTFNPSSSSPKIEKCRNSLCSPESIRFNSGSVSLRSDQGTSLGARSPSNIGGREDVSATNADSESAIISHRKLPIVGFLKFLTKTSKKCPHDSILSLVLTNCSQSQTQLTKLFFTYEQTIVKECLKPLQHIIECEVPNIIKLRKLFIKSHNDLDSVQAKYNGASHKQQNSQTSNFSGTSYLVAPSGVQQSNSNKLELLRKELDEAIVKFEQARDTYASELYGFICKELELAMLMRNFYTRHAEYHEQVGHIMQGSLPEMNSLLANTPKKLVFGKPIEEHSLCTGRSVSTIVELCIHILHSQALQEEGLFRIPGSSMRIKKLKNAINAWFLTNAQRITDSPDSTSQSATVILSIYELFKDTAGKIVDSNLSGRPFIPPVHNNGISHTNQQALGIEADLIPPSDDNIKSDDWQNSCDCLFDVHTIAGLLKLYLRELPEPLFTHKLYQQFIDASSNESESGRQEDTIDLVVQRLPKPNYDNLRLLIRFLHLLTRFRESNKMTATNLAIAMAPSLIWPPRVTTQNSSRSLASSSEEQSSTEAGLQNINLQMSSLGLSTSQHAQVIENLINRAEIIFPGQIQFTLPLINERAKAGEKRGSQLRNESRIETSSPTGLSTASSSSFSSNSTRSLKGKSEEGKNHKGGSVEGLLDHQTSPPNMPIGIKRSTTGTRTASRSRPMSMFIGDPSSQVPPPIPPAPNTRSHHRQGSIECTTRATPNKPPAPPVPTHSGSQVLESSPATGSLKRNDESSRGSTTSIANLNSTRPSVPPPSRPVDQPHKPVISQTNSGSRTHLEGSRATDASRVDHRLPSVSPVLSLDLDDDDDDAHSIGRDDSSFDNDCISLDQSWTDCDVGLSDIDSSEKITPAPGLSSNQTSRSNCKSDISNSKTSPSSNKIYSGLASDKYDKSNEAGKHSKRICKPNAMAHGLKDGTTKTSCDPAAQNQQAVSGATSSLAASRGRAPAPPSTPQPPVKPPRAVSPKVTQSTPL